MVASTHPPLFAPERWAEVRKLLERFDALDSDVRAAELRRLDAADPDLAYVVRSLLDQTQNSVADPLLDAVQDRVTAGVLEGRHLAAALELERQLAEGRSRPVPMNIDGATAAIFAELGFPPPLCRGLFVLSRSVGILAHAWEQKQQGGRIKGPMPAAILYTYAGPATRVLDRDALHTSVPQDRT